VYNQHNELVHENFLGRFNCQSKKDFVEATQLIEDALKKIPLSDYQLAFNLNGLVHDKMINLRFKSLSQYQEFFEQHKLLSHKEFAKCVVLQKALMTEAKNNNAIHPTQINSFV
jgi:hypothetical protein